MARRPIGQGCVFAVSLILSASAFAAKPHARPRLSEWEQAVALREKLEATPAEQRTREKYETVLAAFRAIYHQNPQAAKAPAAVAAVADLLAEKGRVLHDQRSLHAAIGQYEFLREQYPNSPK